VILVLFTFYLTVSEKAARSISLKTLETNNQTPCGSASFSRAPTICCALPAFPA